MDAQKNNLIKSAIALALMTTGTAAFSAISSGQLTIINGLAYQTSAGSGATASSISVQVSDSTGPCTAATTLAFNGTVLVKWDASKTHSATQCTGITSVAVTPIKTTIGAMTTIVYDSVSSTSVPATTATAITYTAPTTAANNLVLLVTGAGLPGSAQTASGTAWGIGAASAPVFDTNNGSLTTVGVPGGSGLAGFRAEQVAREYGVLPYHSN